MSATLVLPRRFNGPARSANGGFAAGSLAERVADAGRWLRSERSERLETTRSSAVAVEVTLRRPPPLEEPMTVSFVDGVTVLSEQDDRVAEAVPAAQGLEAVEAVPPGVAAEAMLRYPGLRAHPFPSCFACGPNREEGDGLRIFPGPVGADRGFVASLWVPQPGHAESTDLMDGVQRCGVATTWAALDCVGGWSEDLEGRPCVLGRMTARVDALPVVGDAHVVVGRHVGTDGRKSFTVSTLYDSDGRVVGAARHTWIQVDPSAFN